MTVRNLARISNDFKPSSRSLALDDLLSTREVADLLGVNIKTLQDHIRRLQMEPVNLGGRVNRYWSRRQVEQIRMAS